MTDMDHLAAMRRQFDQVMMQRMQRMNSMFPWVDADPDETLPAPPSPPRTKKPPGASLDVLLRIEDVVRRRVLGQSDAVERLLRPLVRMVSPLRDPSRPLVTALLLGPTGVGKTETARAISRALYGADDGVLRISCEEYSHGHEVAKLLGSPPGYVGYNIEPLLSQGRVDLAWKKAAAECRGAVGTDLYLGDRGVSLVLFDEIEKAHPSVWNALLGVLDNGMISLGDNKTTDLRRSVVLMTSNVGGREIDALLERRDLGFDGGTRPAASRSALADEALRAARKTFPAEFLNRFDEVCVYEPLDREALDRILSVMIGDVQFRAIAQGWPIQLDVDDDARAWLLGKGTDPRYGARPLRRAIERELGDPLARVLVGRTRKDVDVRVALTEGRLDFDVVERPDEQEETTILEGEQE